MDSRKCARNELQVNANITQMEQRSSELFHPEMFDRVLVKRRKEEEEPIGADCQGFVNYFTAPNIRNKIKNPFFLAYKFSNFVTLYYNTVRFPNVKVALV